MSPLTLTLKEPPSQRIDLSAVTPDKLLGKSIGEIQAIKLSRRKKALTLGELFNVSGSDTDDIRILQGSPLLDNIGDAMGHGRIDVKGGAGDYLGKDMQGGTLKVQGDVGRWAATGMHAGEIEIDGNAGDFLCGALPGAPMGMQDGLVIVSGSSGDRSGDRMRRGMLIIQQDSGDYCASRMLGGTIIVLGGVGELLGLGMKRGTVILRNRPAVVTATFNYCGPLKMEFLRVLFRYLGGRGGRLEPMKLFGPEAERYVGDLAHGGKGEILILDEALLDKHPDKEQEQRMDYRVSPRSRWQTTGVEY